jgi:hypothetical protein
MKKQQGFAALEAMLIIVVLAAIGFTGWYVWHNSQQTAKQNQASVTKRTTVSQTTGLKLSSSPTFYDCMDAYSAHQSGVPPYSSSDPSHYNWDSKTKICTMNGKSYNLTTTFTDDNIRNTKGMHFTASEAAYLRVIGEKNFKLCSDPADIYGTIDMYGESGGKYLYYGVACDSGHREVAVLQDSDWKVVYSGQDIIACNTITKYDIPHSLFNADNAYGSTAQCFTGSEGTGKAVDLSSL